MKTNMEVNSAGAAKVKNGFHVIHHDAFFSLAIETDEESLWEQIENFFKSYFIHSGHIVQEPGIILDQNTSELRVHLNEFFSNFLTREEVNRSIGAFLDKLPIEHWIFIYLSPSIDNDTSKYMCSELLRFLNGNVKDEARNEVVFKNWEEVENNYNIYWYGERRVRIGTHDKKDRKCRFCGIGNSPKSFKNKSHAISQALGNIKLISLDICDNCNRYFGQNIEPELIKTFSILRAISGVKGKNGAQRVKNKNFDLTNTVDGTYLRLHNVDQIRQKGNQFIIPLETNFKVVPQIVYKALCFYFLSVVPIDYLPVFSRTIDWVKGGAYSIDLPPVIFALRFGPPASHPEIAFYIQRADNTSLPFAFAELIFLNCKLDFIIPFSANQELTTEKIENWVKFRLAYFEGIPDWAASVWDICPFQQLDFLMTLKGIFVNNSTSRNS